MPNNPNGNESTQDISALIENASTGLRERLQGLQETEDALRVSEQRLNAAEEERDTLRRELAEITNTAHRRARGSANAPSDNENEAPAAKRAQPSTDGDDAPRPSLEEDAVQAGRKYAMNGMPWLLVLPAADFFKTTRIDEFDMSTRHDSDVNRVQGQLHEIYNMLPEHLKEYFQTRWFAKAFHHGMRTQISNTAHRIRADGSALLFPAESHHFLSSEGRLAYFKDQLGYVPPANGQPEQYPPLECPLLHDGPPVDGKFDATTRFKPYMFKLIHILFLRGKKSATVAKTHVGRIHKPQGVYMQEKHHIKFLTPGAAALCFILGRWLVSADARLEPTGAETAIDYKADFNDYLRILQHGLDRRLPSVRSLFRDWDRLVFGLEPSRYGGTGALPQSVRNAEIEAAIGAMDEEEPEPPSEEEDESGGGNGSGNGGNSDDGD